MFLNTCGYCKNIRVKYDVVRLETDLFDQNLISTGTNLYFTFHRIGLTFFIKSHDDGCCTIFANDFSLFDKLFLAFFHRNRVDNTLALHTFQTRFDDVEF